MRTSDKLGESTKSTEFGWLELDDVRESMAPGDLKVISQFSRVTLFGISVSSGSVNEMFLSSRGA
jgi:hypothetical protein